MPTKIAVSTIEWEIIGGCGSGQDSSRAKQQSSNSNTTESCLAPKYQPKKEGKKKTKKKDPNKPKHPLTAYMYYSSEQRPKLKTSAALGEGWRSLLIEERREYEGLAEQDRLRYHREMKVYNANGGDKRSVTPLPSRSNTTATSSEAFI